MASWISEGAMTTWNKDVRVEAISNWIDCRPIADFALNNSGAIINQKCELGDLLLIVEVKRSGLPKPERNAMLLQGKVCPTPQTLPNLSKTFPGSDSTQKQRNLFEVHQGQFSLYEAANSKKFVGGPYQLATKDPKFPFLGLYARYLLIPALRKTTGANWSHWVSSLPYQTLWPDARTGVSGQCLHLADLILALAHLGPQKHGQSINDQNDWSRMVKDILAFTGKTNIDRFKATKKATLSAGLLVTIKQMVIDRITAINWHHWAWFDKLIYSTRLHVVPPTRGGVTAEKGEPRQGMLVLRIRLSDTDEFAFED